MAKKRDDARSEATEAEASLDEVLRGLEQVVDELERGDLPLEKALERFEHGVRLARNGERLLDSVEQRVEMLLADRDEVVAFDETQQDED